MIFANGTVEKGDSVRCLNGCGKLRKVVDIVDSIKPTAVLDDGRKVPEQAASVAWVRVPPKPISRTVASISKAGCLKVYIAGPMSGLPDFNRPAFFRVEHALSAAGITPLNPARLPDGLDYQAYMRIGAAMLREADAICLIPGWKKSKGACVEIELAKRLGKQVFFLR